MIGRTVDGTSLSLPRLKHFDQHKKIVKDHKDPTDDTPKVSKTYHISKALDMLPNYLRSKLGVRGVALSYVIRELETPPALEQLHNDVPYAQVSGSLMEELISHTPHNGVGWTEDNAMVFGILQEMVRDAPMASSLKRHQRARDGRGAYLSLVQHNLGSAQWDKVIERAEEVQSTRVWNGRNSRYSIKKHIDNHRDAYNDMVRATEHKAYEVPNEHTRVSRLLKSVQANHIASIAAAKTTIEATPGKRGDFELAADFLVLNAPTSKVMQDDHRISAVSQGSKRHSGNPKNGEDDRTLDDLKHVKIEDRFYNQSEYPSLTHDQKYKLKLLRATRGDQSARQGKGRRRTQSRKDNFKKMKAENKDFMQRIAALESKLSGDTDDTSDDNANTDKSTKTDNSKKVSFNQRKR